MWLVVLLVLLATVYLYLKFHYDYWKRRGVSGPQPQFFIGNLGKCLLLKKSPGELFTEVYRTFPNEPVVGIFKATTPCLVIRDPDLIRDVCVRHFNHFQNNDWEIHVKDDALYGRNIFVLRGDEWKATRALLTPSFTAGKMKPLFPIMDEMARQFVDYIKNHQNEPLEGKELCTKFTLSNVASCAFGLEANCFKNPHSDFKQLADAYLSPQGFTAYRIVFSLMIPILTKIWPLKFTPPNIEKKLVEIVGETLRHRDANKIVRNDFLDSMNQLKKVEGFTDVDVTAQASGFFTDGYETSSYVVSYILYELAKNPHVQRKLRDEVKDVDLTYENLIALPYLDAVLNETLRIHPATFFMARRCSEPYSMTVNNKTVIIEKETTVVLPFYGLQHDPQYWPDPETFIPERFLDENRDKIVKYTFSPFGEGPRMCIGQRFGSLQVKLGIANVVKNFEMSVNGRTQEPIRYDPVYFLLAPIGGLWIDFKEVQP